MTGSNVLYYGDNLDVLRRYVKDETVDLVYLDPPFKSNQDYNVLFQEQDGTRSRAQIKAFHDTWRWDEEAAQTFEETVEAGGKVSQVLQAFRTFLGPTDMLAYLAMMAPRLKELSRVLKPTGNLFLHCDPTAGHYLKLLLDAVFGPLQFRNEIVWRRTGSHNSSRRFGPIHDSILFYSRADGYFFKRIFRPYLRGHVESYFKKEDERGKYWPNALTGAGTRKGESGFPWHGYDPTAVGRHWAIPGRIFEELGLDDSLSTQEKLDALDAAGFVVHPGAESGAMPTYRQYLADSPGMPLQDIWAYQPHTRGVLYETTEGIDEDVRWLVKQGDPERLGYQTQKPEGILKRIIESACPPDGVVLDPFCGCGTAIAAAQRLGRPWIGIDITQAAIVVIKKRLRDAWPAIAFDIKGEPVSVPDARALAEQDRFQFQWWALGLVDARPLEEKRGADKGLDGRLYFHDETSGPTKSIVISVKSGGVGADDVRDLRAVLEREKAQIGVLITLENPTRPMMQEGIEAGFYASSWGKHRRLQILTVAELLAGKKIDYPPTKADSTFKKAPRAIHAEPTDQELPLEIVTEQPASQKRPRARRRRP